MNGLFCGLFSRRPAKVICGDSYYGTDADGDQFFEDGPGETWKEKFIKRGFEIESCDKSYYHKWDKSDNEFGKQAERAGIDIGDITTLYVLRKV